MLISAIEAGVSIEEYDVMSMLEIAYMITGYRERTYNDMYYQRYMTWLTMKPHVKEGTLKAPADIFTLPIDEVQSTNGSTSRADVEEAMRRWKEKEGKERKKIKTIMQ